MLLPLLHIPKVNICSSIIGSWAKCHVRVSLARSYVEMDTIGKKSVDTCDNIMKSAFSDLLIK